MNAYSPHDGGVVWILLALLVSTLVIAYAVACMRSLRGARLAAWLLVTLLVVGAERLTAGEPAGFRMLALIAVLLYAMKGVVSVEARAAGQTPLPFLRWLAFAAAWPGMRPALFAESRGRRHPGGWALVGKGCLRLGAGLALFVGARWAVHAQVSLLLATALALPGLSLILHFGIFNVVAGTWRLFGIDAVPLFRAPLLSRSLAEFWGRRWNLAFSEMTALGVYRPLIPVIGQPAATVVAFLASGLLHELAISVPVRAGFGLPMSYFVLHGVLMLLERAISQTGRPISQHAWLGRAWTLAWLSLPLPILFHRPFLAGVIWPLLGLEHGY